MEFRSLEKTDKDIFTKCLGDSHSHFGWEYDFNVIWAWDTKGFARICDTGDAVITYTRVGDKTLFYPPVVREESRFAEAVALAAGQAKALGVPFMMVGIEEDYVKYIDKSKYNLTSSQDNWDYIYNTEETAGLVGKKYHAKRNFINRFKSTYKYSVDSYTDKDFDEVMQLAGQWLENAGHEVMGAELCAIERSLKSCDELGYTVTLLRADDRLAAFSVCSLSNKRMAHYLFEKADVSVMGAYPVITNETLSGPLKGYEYTNRQEDMGIEGLRKSKLSYKPAFQLKKYLLTEK